MQDIMRKNYRALNEVEKKHLTDIKDCGEEFYKAIDALGSSRELSLAKTKIEEAVMWATKHITAPLPNVN